MFHAPFDNCQLTKRSRAQAAHGLALRVVFSSLWQVGELAHDARQRWKTRTQSTSVWIVGGLDGPVWFPGSQSVFQL